jgi:Cdc6-like AAA superfamily ATPase
MHLEAERESILKWLVSTDPSPIHNRASELHEPHTGTWLVYSEEYKAWKTGSMRLMWLHGIPGSGKTVLASFVIKDVREYCKTSAPVGSAWAYYYCYFGRSQDETPHLIRWVINQLCRQSKFIPAEVRELYQEGAQPTTSDLVLLLHTVLRHFHRVLLIIDALDESSNRWNILNWLLKAIDDESTNKLQILTLSRKELDIQDALGPISKAMSLSNPYVDADIRIYIQNHLRDDRKFGRWSAVLKADVEAALVVGAKGMYVNRGRRQYLLCHPS